jgi:hypothetical protein
MNNANAEKPTLTILTPNAVGNELVPKELFTHFDFSKYNYAECVINTWAQFILVSCKTPGNDSNDILLLCDLDQNTVDETSYGCKSMGKDGVNLYVGSSLSETVYQIFDGYDDLDNVIENYWDSRGERYDSERLKKYRKIRLQGLIDVDQYVEVYANYDDAGYELVGTVRGDGTYVDNANPQSVGTSMVGERLVGGNSGSVAYPYFWEMKISQAKFRKRKIRFVAKGFGYASIRNMTDVDILTYEEKIPKRFRMKQRVNLAGNLTNQ